MRLLLVLLPLGGCHLFAKAQIDQTCEDLAGGCGVGEGGGDDGTTDAIDGDGDGYTAADGDCDDGDSRIHPGAQEACDAADADEDCDGAADDLDDDAIGKSLWFLDLDGDGYGDPNQTLSACDTPPGYLTLAGDCDDSTAAANPGAVEVCGDGLDNNCDGSPNTCGRWEGTLAASAVSGGALASGTYFGNTLAIGDATGDGADDLVVGTFDGTPSGTGGAVIFTRFDRDPVQELSERVAVVSAAATGYGGAQVTLRDDVTGDGYADLLQYGTDNTFFLAEGPFYGATDMEAAYATFPDVYTSSNGRSVDLVDLTGDGAGDLALAHSYGTGGQSGIYIWEGPLRSGAHARSTATAWVLDASAVVGGFGETATYAGDYNGDGYRDLAVGAPNDDRGDETGTAWIFEGPFRGSYNLTDSDAVLFGDKPGTAGFGMTLSTGDSDGDGTDELAIATAVYGTEFTNGGVFVFSGTLRGPVTGADAIAGFVGDDPYTAYAFTLDGDLDHDGTADLAVADPLDSTLASNAGALHLVYGPLAGVYTPASADLSIYASVVDAYMGQGVTMAGDLSGDGIDDLAVGSYSYVGVVGVLFGQGI